MGRKKYHWIQQQSGEDCAAASLAIVCAHYNRPMRIDRIRQAVTTDSGGASFASLRRGAESIGFLTKVLQAPKEWLDTIDAAMLPAIIYWKGYHLVVVHGRERGRSGKNDVFVVSDPALGVRRLSRTELENGWQSGLVLLLKPHPVRFHLENADTQLSGNFLWQRLQPERASLVAIALLGVLMAAIGLALPLLAEWLLDDVLQAGRAVASTGGAPRTRVSLAATSALAAFALWQVTHSAGDWARTLVAERLSRRLSFNLLLAFGQQLLRLPLSYYESRNSAMVRNRLADLDRITATIVGVIVDVPKQVATVLFASVMLAYFNWWLLVVAAAGSVAVAVIAAWLLPAMRQAGMRRAVASGESFFLLSQFFSNALTIRSVPSASALDVDLQRTLHDESAATRNSTLVMERGAAISRFCLGLSAAFAIAVATVLGLQAQLTVGRVVAVVILAFLAINGFLSLALLALNATRVKADVQLLDDVYAVRPEDDEPKPAEAAPLPVGTDLRCTNISFQYAGRQPLFKDLSICFPGGKVTAILGASGCGKSTLVSIIAGLHTPGAGHVLLGDADLKDYSLEMRRRAITYVPQEARFLTRSVTDNMRLGAPHMTQQCVEACCRVAGAHDFVMTLPSGYDTMLGDFSAKLSGGEKQRLALARALLVNAPIMIMDESTSSLDSRMETEVLDRVLAHREGKTTVLVSHRDSIVERADHIVILEPGQVRFAGSRAEYLAM